MGIILIKKRMRIATVCCCCLIIGLNSSLVFAANEGNPNLEYIRMGMELSDQIEELLQQGNFTQDDTLTAEVKSKIALGKKRADNAKSNQVATDEFATDANNANINLFLTQAGDYLITETSGQLKGYRTSGIVYLTELTGNVTVLEASDVVIARERAKEIAEGIKSKTSSKKEMVRLANEYITENTVYIKNYNTETQKWLWSSTGPILHGEAVCMGYSYAFKSILDELGIPVETIVGESKNGVNHAWSRCRIEGEWYYNDITFNDPVGGNPTEDYLLLNKSEFYKKIGHKATYDPDEKVADNVYNTVYRNNQEYEANVLKNKGLFMGDERGLRLEDGLTRVEMAALLTRVTGGIAEVEANGEFYSKKCVFTDVPVWAKKYVGYCYEKGLVKGIGQGVFGSNNKASKLDFCTVMLRATGVTSGYEYTTSDVKAVDLGYINEGRTAFADLNRADVVHVIYNVNSLGKI